LPRIRLDSTALAWIRYQEPEHILQVGLRSGREYAYSEVPSAVYRELLAAPSQGRYYNANIRNDFPYQEIRRRGNSRQ
jgi:hypothetical protein